MATPTPADIAPKADPKPAEPDVTVTEPEPQAPEGDAPAPDALGDAGKQALDRMKAERNAAKAEAKAAAEERDRLKAASEGREAEWEAERKARAESDARFNERVLNAEIKAAAARKLDAPELALKLVDRTDLEVGEDGDVDEAAVEAAIDALIAKYPNLAAQSGSRNWGSSDSGPRNVGEQKSEEDTLIEAIAKAEASRNVAASVSLKQRLEQLRKSKS